MNTYESLKEFYPTPVELVAKMIEGIRFKSGNSILEPSAGSGNIVKFIAFANNTLNDHWRYKYYEGTLDEKRKQIIENDAVKRYYDYEEDDTKNYFPHINFDIDCIEIDKNLQAILKNHDFNVIADDFLSFETSKMYDYIIMNPPFSDGDKHLMKAIKLAEKNGGSQIICLLNAETIRNPYSRSRVELKDTLDKYDATYEFINNAFSNAERKTDVDIVIVRVTVPNLNQFKFDWSDLDIGADDMNYDVPEECSELVIGDKLKQPVLMYRREIELGKRLIYEYNAIKDKISCGFTNENDPNDYDSYKKEAIIHLKVGDNDLAGRLTTLSEVINTYIERVRYKYWYELLHEPFFMKGLPSDAQNEYFGEIEKLSKYEFSIPNICRIQLDILSKTAESIEKSIVNLFEKFTYEHSMGCEKNVHYFNGWMSNDAFIINKKIVIPYMNCFNSYNGELNIDYTARRFFADIERIFAYFDAEPIFSDIDYICNEYNHFGQSKKCEFKYFFVDFYKKGTVHITFKDDELLKKFNIYGCLKKGWLPPSYGMKSYNEMAEEEKNVIDEFEGANEYAKVFANTEDYIVFPESSVKMLSA